MKDISLRPKKQLMGLLEAVQNLEYLPNTNRNSIIDRALDVALASSYINWQAVSEMLIEEEEAFTGHIPNHIVLKVDPEKFSQVNEQIKSAFKAEKITIPYTLKLLLSLYFIHLKKQREPMMQNEQLDEILTSPSAQIDTLRLKSEYEHSIYSGKKRLLNVCKVLLQQSPTIHDEVLRAGKRDLDLFMGYLDLNKYFVDGPEEKNPTLTYLAKVLAGLFILCIESTTQPNESKNELDKVVKKMEIEFQSVGYATIQDHKGDYYKDVYAKMMGGKI